MDTANPRAHSRLWAVRPLRVVLLSALLTTAIYIFHQRSDVSGWFQWDDPTIVNVVATHASYESFAQRLLTTKAGYFIAWHTSLTLSQAFAIIWFGGLFLTGIVAFHLGGLTTRSEGGGWCAMLLLLVSWPVFNLFVSPLAGWDDPLQFLFILLSLVSLVRWVRGHRAVDLVAFSLLTLVGLFARDTGMLLLPSILLVACSYLPRKRWWSTALACVLPVLTWEACRYLMLRDNYHLLSQLNHQAVRKDWYPHHKHMLINFYSIENTLQSLAAPVVVLAPYCCLLALAWPRLTRRVRLALVGALVLNTLAVELLALPEESRLFFLPVLLLVPSVGWEAREKVLRSFRPEVVRDVVRGWGIVVLGVLVAGSFAVASYVYPALHSPHRSIETWIPMVVASVLGVFSYASARLDRGTQGNTGSDVVIVPAGRAGAVDVSGRQPSPSLRGWAWYHETAVRTRNPVRIRDGRATVSLRASQIRVRATVP